MSNGGWIRPRALIGMVHVGPLPGTPRLGADVPTLAMQAAAEARVLEECGFDAVMIENMHDRPYVHGRQGPEIVAAMTRVADEVTAAIQIPLGVQVLSGGEREALAIALAAEAQFVRCENFVYSHVADEGLLAEAVAGPLLRYRRAIGAQHIRIMCDVKKKHASHAITADVSLEDCAHTAEFCGADGVIVTGTFTGRPTSVDDVRRVRAAVGVPVWAGSGADPSQLGALFEHADAVVVGSWVKAGGVWSNPVDRSRSEEMVREASRVRV